MKKSYSFLVKREKFYTLWIILAFLASLLGPISPAYAVDVPVLLKPDPGAKITATGSGENAQPPAALPEFSWSSVSGTTYYRIQFSQQIGFNTVAFEAVTQLTHYLPPQSSTFTDGLWYWRVRVESPVTGSFSAPGSFTREWASLDNLPLLLSPAEGATVEFFDVPVFSWQPVIGAARYKLQISTSPTLTPLTYLTTAIATTHQPETKFSNGQYYWAVTPIDPNNRDGTRSSIRSFTMAYNQVPVLLEPQNNSFPTFTPTFHWTAVRGANLYRLEYSTDPTFASQTTTIDTNNTTYTPKQTLPNDVNYYWRVKAYSNQSVSNWSQAWTFKKQWYIQPVLLTPTNNFQNVRIPTFSWAPVPGAQYYRFEMDDALDFNSPLLVENTSNPFYTPQAYQSAWTDMYWRVIPYDAADNRGLPSDPRFFKSSPSKLTPELVSPLYYYPPNSFPPPFNTVAMNPYADRTVSLPVFYWHRLTAYPGGENAAYAYRIQVATTATFINSIVWSVDTQNTHAAPTAGNPFTPQAGTDYYWRVNGLDSNLNLIGNWSQTWKARITLPSASNLPDPPPQLRRPLHGAEFVEATPLLEWWSVAGADGYEVQISRDASFTAVVDSSIVTYPVYSPTASLAQRSLASLNYGTFYWRVQARSGANPLGDWSETRRFQVASQSGRVSARTLGSASGRLLIASDPDDTADNNFELTTLYAMQDSSSWYVGFNITTTLTDMTYALYLDLDHLDGSGATSDARAYPLTAVPAHRPEYAVYVNQIAGVVADSLTELYAWNGSSWDFVDLLSNIGGGVFHDLPTGYVEVKLPNTAIGMSDTTGSYALSLFSLPANPALPPVDSVPSDPAVPGSGPISRFASASERMNTIVPANTPEGDPEVYPAILPFEWDYPAVTDGTAPWAGAWTRIYKDPLYTNEVASFQIVSDSSYYSFISHHWPYDFQGDNTYYWRIQPCYLFTGVRVCGVWTQGGRFERRGFVPTNLTESVAFATPTFSWSLVEGARTYEIQVDNDSNFNSPEVSDTTTQNSYTPSYTLNSGTYYWRLRVYRYQNPTSNWTTPKSFTITLPIPTGLTPNDPDPNNAINTSPTLCWQPLIVSANGNPVLAAYRYRVQIIKGDPTFTNPTQVDTEQACWTPINGYEDGTYYWRVAMLDGQGRQGAFSPAATFTKQYPTAEPVSPLNGSAVSQTPTFVWAAQGGIPPYVFGAASYKIEISQSDTFVPLYDQIITNNTRFVPTKIYEINKTYYWRVAIIDGDGRVGPFNDATLILNPYPYPIYLPLITR